MRIIIFSQGLQRKLPRSKKQIFFSPTQTGFVDSALFYSVTPIGSLTRKVEACLTESMGFSECCLGGDYYCSAWNVCCCCLTIPLLCCGKSCRKLCMKTKGDRALKKQQQVHSAQSTAVVGQQPPQTVTVVHVHHQPGMPPSPPEVNLPPGYNTQQV